MTTAGEILLGILVHSATHISHTHYYLVLIVVACSRFGVFAEKISWIQIMIAQVKLQML